MDALSSLERLLTLLHDEGFTQYTVADLGDTVTVAVTVPAPASTEADPLATPAWADTCRRWYCVWTAGEQTTIGIWGLPDASHYKEWRKGLKLGTHRAFSSFEEAREGWNAETGYADAGVPELHQYEC